MKLIEGKQYKLKGKSSLGWFPVNAVITLGKLYTGADTYNATGPASSRNVGGYSCSKGEIITAFVQGDELEELADEVVEDSVSFSVTVAGNKTSIEVLRALTPDEVSRILAIIGG